MTEWHWSKPVESLPDEAFLVLSCTKYTEDGWEQIKGIVEASHHKMAAHPSVLGHAHRAVPEMRAVRSMYLWESYDALEAFVKEQIEWLGPLLKKYQHTMEARHNAYRIIRVVELPLSWEEADAIVDEVRRISPLGADAFPELSKALGIKQKG